MKRLKLCVCILGHGGAYYKPGYLIRKVASPLPADSYEPSLVAFRIWGTDFFLQVKPYVGFQHREQLTVDLVSEELSGCFIS